MDVLIRDRAYTGPVRAVILDWAGTAVDYGCLGPTQVFREVFSAHGVPVTAEEARAFMDMRTINRLRAMTGLDSVAAKWRETHGRGPDERDVQTLYEMAEPRMLARIEERAALFPGLLEAEALDPVALQTRLDVLEARFRAAGAHFVARGIWETQALVEEIEARLAAGERP